MIDLRLGDCLEVMKGMDANSVDAVVCDPPYGLEFMGKEWDKFKDTSEFSQKWNNGKDWTGRVRKRPGRLYMRSFHYVCQKCRKQKHLHDDEKCKNPEYLREIHKPRQMKGYQRWAEEWAVEALRVAKPGAHLLAFGGTRTFHRLACAIEDAGWEIRDTIGWLYGSGFPKSHNLKDEWQGWGTALKPAWEPVIVARKPVNCTVAENVLKWGTGAMNIDASRIPINGEKINVGSQHGGGEYEGWGFKMGLPRQEGQGRWPANLIHDGSDEVVALFPETKSGDHKPFKRSNKPTVYGNNGMFAKGFNCNFENFGDSGSAARFFYCAKASKRDRDEGLEGMNGKEVKSWHFKCKKCGKTYSEQKYKSGCHCEDPEVVSWSGISQNHHPTVKPTALMQYLCRLVTPPGGVILDPFMGSGSTGKAAVLEGFNFIGIELDPEYFEIAEKRIEFAQREKKQLELPI